MPRGSTSVASSLEESQHVSFDSDDRPIGTIIAAVEKQKAVEKGRKVRPLEAMDEDAQEDVLPFKRKAGKSKDSGTFEASNDIIVALLVERLATKEVKKSKKVKEGLRRLKEETQSFIATKKLGKEIREK